MRICVFNKSYIAWGCECLSEMSSSEAFKTFAGGAICIVQAHGGVRAVSVESIADVGAETGGCKIDMQIIRSLEVI